MTDLAPDALLLEGFNEKETPRDDLIAHAQNSPNDPSEILNAIRLATKAKIPFYGGEPTGGYIGQELLKLGYTMWDIWCRDCIASIPKACRKGLRQDDLNGYLKAYLEVYLEAYLESSSEEPLAKPSEGNLEGPLEGDLTRDYEQHSINDLDTTPQPRTSDLLNDLTAWLHA